MMFFFSLMLNMIYYLTNLGNLDLCKPILNLFINKKKYFILLSTVHSGLKTHHMWGYNWIHVHYSDMNRWCVLKMYKRDHIWAVRSVIFSIEDGRDNFRIQGESLSKRSNVHLSPSVITGHFTKNGLIFASQVTDCEEHLQTLLRAKILWSICVFRENVL